MCVPSLAVLWDALVEGLPESQLLPLTLACQAALPESLHAALWAHVSGLWLAAHFGLPPTRVETRAANCSLEGTRHLSATTPAPRHCTMLWGLPVAVALPDSVRGIWWDARRPDGSGGVVYRYWR